MNIDTIKKIVDEMDSEYIDKVWLRTDSDKYGELPRDSEIKLFVTTSEISRRDARILSSKLSRMIEDFVPDGDLISVMPLTGLPQEDIDRATDNLYLIYSKG